MCILSFPAPNSLETKAIAKGAEVSAWSSSAHSHGPPAVCGFWAVPMGFPQYRTVRTCSNHYHSQSGLVTLVSS